MKRFNCTVGDKRGVNGDCMELHESGRFLRYSEASNRILELEDRVKNQSDKIAELEADNKRLKAKVFASFNKKLEQQIGAISDYSESLLNNLNTYSVDDVNAFEESYINALRKQAKALKEQVK